MTSSLGRQRDVIVFRLDLDGRNAVLVCAMIVPGTANDGKVEHAISG